jgi:hypothetical protein
MARFGKTLLAAMALMSAASASATTVIYTANAFTGVNAPGAQTVTTWNIAPPPIGQTILAANFTSAFGNDLIPTSAFGTVTVGGIEVGVCNAAAPCEVDFSGFPTPFSYDFDPSEFSSLLGSVSLVYNQTACCVPQLSASTLTITFGAPVPEPANWALLIAGFGLVGAAMRRRVHAIA